MIFNRQFFICEIFIFSSCRKAKKSQKNDQNDRYLSVCYHHSTQFNIQRSKYLVHIGRLRLLPEWIFHFLKLSYFPLCRVLVKAQNEKLFWVASRIFIIAFKTLLFQHARVHNFFLTKFIKICPSKVIKRG